MPESEEISKCQGGSWVSYEKKRENLLTEVEIHHVQFIMRSSLNFLFVPLLAAGLGLSGCAKETGGSRAMTRLDLNRDGYVSQSEAAKMPVLAKNYTRVDVDRDGRISEVELLQAQQVRASRRTQGGGTYPDAGYSTQTASAPPANRPARSGGAAGSSGRMEQAFAQMDINGNGVLTSDEVTGRFAEKFEQVDANGDSFVTMEEVQIAMQQRGSRSGSGSGSRRGGGNTAPMPPDADLYIQEEDLAVENYETILVAPDGSSAAAREPSSDLPPSDVSLRVDEEGYFVPGN